jgi:2-keto-4-pentenoate hydratase/2-oxohepta-3-ene-1,7-dioic acid hydratase in catechol pathway
MKLCTFEVSAPTGTVQRIGLLTAGEKILDLNFAAALALAKKSSRRRAQALADALLPPDMLAYMENGAAGRETLAAALEHLGDAVNDPSLRGINGERIVWQQNEVRVLAPIPRPRSIRDALCFELHYKNALKGAPIPPVWYEIPLYYKGNPNTVQGTGSDVKWPSYTEKLDYELELAAIIGRDGVNLNREEAWQYIFGYTIFNDVSARDIQLKEMSGWLGPSKGKDMDGGNVLGPYLVTADEWDPRDGHEMTARVNGERWGGGSTKSMYHDYGKVISYISRNETILPGDVIGSGTVGTGCGLELDRYPQPGDVIELEVEGLGTLTTRYVR